MPSYFVNFGPGILSACIGGDYVLANDTVWFDRAPIISDWSNPPAIVFDEDSPMWGNVLNLQKRFLKDENIITAMTDLGGTLDVIASLRSSQELLYDLYDYPEAVKQMISLVDDIWFKAFNKLEGILSKTQTEFTTWMGIISKIPYYPLQCDFSAMISPSQFEEFVLPSIVTQTSNLRRSIYHLDGVGEIPHLDMLLNVENLTGIQWVPGDGKEDLTDECWFPLYKRIQDKKKNLVLLDAQKDNLERLVKSIENTGVFITAECENQNEAEQLLDDFNRWLS